MRKGALYLLLVVALLTGIVLYFVRDRRIESFIERTASDSNGGKVEIDNFHFSVLNLTCKFDRLQWTDPSDRWRNLFETGPVEFGMEARPLFWKKFIINEMKVSGVMAGTQRATDGYWPKPPEEPGILDDVMKSIETEVRSLPAFQLAGLKQKANLDSLLSIVPLQAVQSAMALRNDVDTTGAHWQDFLKTYDAKQKIEALENQAKAVSLADTKDLNGLVSTLQKVNDLRTNANALRQEITETKKRAEGDFGRLTGVAKNLDNLAKTDFETLKQKIGLSDFDFKDVGKFLFGNPFRERFQGVMQYIDLGRRYWPTAQKLMAVNKVQNPPRFKGQDLAFPRTFAYPEFLIRNLHLSAAVGSAVRRNDLGEAIQIIGEASGITNEPPVYGRPTTFALDVSKQSSNAYAISGVLDHTGTVAADTLRVGAANFRLGKIDFKQSKAFLPSQLDGQRGTVNATLALRGDELRAQAKLSIDQAEFVFADSAASDILTQAIRGVFAEVNDFRFSATVAGPARDLKFRISSNLDELFAQRVRGVVQEGVNRAQQELRQRVDKEVGAARQQAETELGAKQALVMNEVNKYEKMVQDQLAILDTKKQEIEKKIEAEKKKGQEKLKKGLEKLLKP